MFIEKRNVRVDVLIPSSFSHESHHPIEKIVRLGSVARYLAAFRVDTLIIYHEELNNPDEENAKHIKLVMDYLNTAPYLRRRIYPLTPKLRYVGVLPPLNIPTHPEKEDLNVEHYREGLVISSNKKSTIYAGLKKMIKIDKKLKEGSRIIVRVKPSQDKIRFKVYSKRKSKIYSGFKTAIVSQRLDEIIRGYDVKIATSRLGVDVRSIWNELKEKIEKASRVCIVFGSAKRGLKEIAELHNIDYEKTFDYIVNTFPNQSVRTIRTEEAIAYTLAIFNLITP